MARTTKVRGGISVASKALVILGTGFALASILAPVASALPMDEGSQVLEQQPEFDLSPHFCDAAMALGEDISEGREESEVETIDAPPSQSPSLSMSCSDPYSNIRGSYTSKKAPCVVTFHNEDTFLGNGEDLKEMQEEPENDVGVDQGKNNGVANMPNPPLYYQGTSSICGIDNAIGEAKEYVAGWPDECVGDFPRCYDLKNPHHSLCEDLYNLLGKLEAGSKRSGMTLVPPGTTHVSVDCTIDRETLIDGLERMERLEHDKIRESVSADKERTLFTVGSILFAVLIVLVAISHLVVQPIVGAIGEAHGRRRRRHVRNGSGGGGNNQFSSLVANDTSGFRLESDDDDESENGPTVGANPDLQEGLPLDEIEMEGTTVSSPQEPIQIEVDDIPIVSATILPLHVIHAEVIGDAVRYEQ